jgi:prepilin-type N-terminal cleavage/methylation domain-containing protein
MQIAASGSVSQPPFAPRCPRTAQRGFTLIEMMTVVTLITIFAAGSIPLVVKQMRERRTQEDATQIAELYRGAKMRAMGRGVAVLVRYASGVFTAMEAQLGSSGTGNLLLPVPSCLTPNWNGSVGDDYRVVKVLQATQSPYDGVSLAMKQGTNAVTALDVCYTPMGRTFFRTNVAQPLLPLTVAHHAELTRPGTSRIRHVAILPNGGARVLVTVP